MKLDWPENLAAVEVKDIPKLYLPTLKTAFDDQLIKLTLSNFSHNHRGFTTWVFEYCGCKFKMVTVPASNTFVVRVELLEWCV
jgi:hypothetical protein